MASLKMNATTSDLDLSTNNLVIITGDDALVQHLRSRLRFFRGEWFLNELIGFPYWTDVFIKDPNLTAIRSFYRQTILTTPGIDSISKLDLDFDRAARQLSVTFTAVKDDGEILEFDEEFILI
jgi:hypothetical protein